MVKACARKENKYNSNINSLRKNFKRKKRKWEK